MAEIQKVAGILGDMGDFLRNRFVLKNKIEKNENSTFIMVDGHGRYGKHGGGHSQCSG